MIDEERDSNPREVFIKSMFLKIKLNYLAEYSIISLIFLSL